MKAGRKTDGDRDRNEGIYRQASLHIALCRDGISGRLTRMPCQARVISRICKKAWPYRVTHHVRQNLPLISKQKFRFGLAWPGQSGTLVIMSTGGFDERDVSPCTSSKNFHRLFFVSFPSSYFDSVKVMKRESYGFQKPSTVVAQLSSFSSEFEVVCHQ